MTFNKKKKLLLILWGLIKSNKKQKIIILLFFTVIGGFAEILSIGSVVPFIASITSPDTLFNHPVMANFHDVFNIGSPDDLILPMTLIFITLAILAGTIRTVLLKFGTTLSFAIGVDLDVLTYKHYVYQDYEKNINANTSEAVSVITKKNTIINSSIIHAFITLLSASLMSAIVLSVLIFINPFISLFIVLIIGSMYILVSRLTRGIISNNGEVISSNSDHMLKNMQETFGAFRDVTIDKSQKYFIKKFSIFDEKVKKSEASNVFISQSPRLVIESFGMVLIAITAYLLSIMESELGVIPVLALLAVSAQRLMPLFQQIYFSISNLNGAYPILRDVLAIVGKEKEFIDKEKKFVDIKEPIKLSKDILINNISYKYPGKDKFALIDINLSIKKGECVGFIGESGSGKSTLLDIILGLLPPTRGGMYVDGCEINISNKNSWFDSISHVPQSIYLLDTTIENNVCFGSDEKESNKAKLLTALKDSEIYDYTISQEGGLKSVIGEYGVRMSGGQRQRLGISRALYKRADLLILDEATSALDSKIEARVINNIVKRNADTTIIMVAHRISTLKHCDRIYKIKEGAIEGVYSYDELK